MASIKAQVEELENKISEYEQYADSEEIISDTTVADPVEENVEEPVEVAHVEPVETEPVEEILDDVMDIELEPSDDLPFYNDLPVSEPEVDDLPEEIINEPDVETVPEQESVMEPISITEPDPVVEPESVVAHVPVIDAMIAKQPWRTDMPGSPVRDIRSAISLNDRILFINYLFGEDPMAFQEMLTQLNAMTSFDEAAAHAIAAYPEWNLESDTVYRFMMALRRRHQ